MWSFISDQDSMVKQNHKFGNGALVPMFVSVSNFSFPEIVLLNTSVGKVRLEYIFII